MISRMRFSRMKISRITFSPKFKIAWLLVFYSGSKVRMQTWDKKKSLNRITGEERTVPGSKPTSSVITLQHSAIFQNLVAPGRGSEVLPRLRRRHAPSAHLQVRRHGGQRRHPDPPGAVRPAAGSQVIAFSFLIKNKLQCSWSGALRSETPKAVHRDGQKALKCFIFST